MTVLHIVGTLNAGGIERLVTDLCEYQQTVFADRPAVACFIRRQGQFVERLLGLGIPVFDVGPRFGLQVVAAVRLTGVLRQLRPDIVHTHVNFSLPWQFAPLRLYGVPAVITQHTTFGLSPPVKLRAGLSYRLLKGCRFVHTAVSTCSADYAAELYRTARAAIKVIPNGIRGAAFGFRQKDREARRAQWRVGPGTLVLGTLGRVTEVKGFDILLRALAILRNTPGMPRLQVSFAGGDFTQGFARKLVQELGLAGSVIWDGMQDDVVPFLSALDVYVHPARRESFGLAVVEALANGLEVVATPTDGCGFITEQSPNVHLAESFEPEVLAKSIAESVQRFSGRAVESRLPGSFVLESMAGAYRQAYVALLEGES